MRPSLVRRASAEGLEKALQDMRVIAEAVVGDDFPLAASSHLSGFAQAYWRVAQVETDPQVKDVYQRLAASYAVSAGLVVDFPTHAKAVDQVQELVQTKRAQDLDAAKREAGAAKSGNRRPRRAPRMFDMAVEDD